MLIGNANIYFGSIFLEKKNNSDAHEKCKCIFLKFPKNHAFELKAFWCQIGIELT